MANTRPESVTLLEEDKYGNQIHRYDIPSNPKGRINLLPQTSFAYHRSGWAAAMDSLMSEHNEQGVIFEGFLDRLFNESWSHPRGVELPLQRPWTGVFHNVPGATVWHEKGTPQSIIVSDAFQKSLPCCCGLFTLSEWLADYFRRETGVNVSSLILPTEIPDRIFDFDAFVSASEQIIVTVGWWLRRIASIYFLPLDAESGFRKLSLVPNGAMQSEFEMAVKAEFARQTMELRRPVPREFRDNTAMLPFLSHDDYDQLLSTSIVFIDLYDSSANNAIVECIARGTPLLINRLPAVEEYLGAQYPFYFDSLEEAADKARNLELVRTTHEYLMQCSTRKRLDPAVFAREFRESEVYQQLPSQSAA